MGNLFTKGASNTKTAKMAGELGIESLILHLAPARLSGFNMCPMASKGCAAACLNTAGRGQFDSTQLARIAKTKKFMADRVGFTNQLAKEIAALVRRCEKNGSLPAVRLNGTSDVRWEIQPVTISGETFDNLMVAFPNVQFYDYTKIPNRYNIPANYDLTFSLSENNDKHAIAALALGLNVAVVFDKLPTTWGGYEVIDGDKNDFRFLDKRGVIVGLKAKGKARHDASGFVRSHLDGFDPSRRVTVAWEVAA